MFTWVIYDISENKTRAYIAKYCKQLGLKRVQKSVFLGIAKKGKVKKLKSEATQRINKQTDRIFIVPMTKMRFKKMIQLGKKFNPRKLIRTDSIHYF